MTLIPGVEINAIVTRDLGLWEGELHILGFGMDPADEAFEATLAAQRRRRRERFEKTVALLRELDLPIDDQLGHLSGSDDDALGRPTVARALIAAGHATSVEDAFRRLLGWGEPAYVPRSGLGPVEAIERDPRGRRAPVAGPFQRGADPDRGRPRAGRMPGSAGWRSTTARSTRRRSSRSARSRRRSRLVPTGGSDYHGDTGTYAETHAGLWVPPEVAAGIPGAGLGVGSPGQP